MTEVNVKTDQLSPLQRAVYALKEVRTKLDKIERAKTEPIAIIGMGCRFPGGADNLESFWELLRNGNDAIRKVPSDRWNVETYYDPDPDAPGKIYTENGGFLDDIDKFDPQFFGISPREAESMDPQQRLLLEVSWETLENAGLVPGRLKGSRTGVFIGITQNDYAHLKLISDDPVNINAYDGTGNAFCFASGRLSYVLGLQGPNMSIDTACSSSLIAVHLACQSLRAGESELALAGGVQLMLSPRISIALSRIKALSADGRSRAFDAAANGFGRGEGCGMIAMKRLSDAVLDNNVVLAVIRGSAVNHDGPSSGLSVPNELSQESLIRQALKNAMVNPDQVDYIEAHGTGTSLGDPIEAGALKSVFAENRKPDHPLIIGSVKSNIGHLESAAGIVGLIKVVLSLQHDEIPPHLHFRQFNPLITWNGFPVTVPTKRMPWPGKGKRRIAGVSSFGMSGSNAHVVLEDASELNTSVPVAPLNRERFSHLLAISAKTEPALTQLAKRYESLLSNVSDRTVGDICYSAGVGRSHFSHRLAIVGETSAKLREKLAAFTTGRTGAGIAYHNMQESNQPKIAFLFTGQGSQYGGMGQELYETQSVFRETINQCDEILRPYLEQPLLKVLYPDTPSSGSQNLLDQTAYTQPALFALEYALAELWKSWGVEPSIVMGHSVGEYVAACVAGVFTLEDGLILISERARLMQELSCDGDMVAVFADEALVIAAIMPYTREVSIAAINGPQSIVISGKRSSVKMVIDSLQEKGIRIKPLQVSHAFHSPLMEPMLGPFAQIAKKVKYSSPQIDVLSNVTGGLVTSELANPEYWLKQIQQPVKFAASMKSLHEQGYKIFVEIGPKPVLLGMGNQCLSEENGIWLPSMSQGRSDWLQMLTGLAKLYVHGVSIDWARYDQNYNRQQVMLPNYPFQRRRYWIEKSEKTESLSQEQQVETSIVNLIRQGDTEQLKQLLTKAGNLPEDKQQLLPELLEILVKQNQQQVKQNTIKEWFYELTWQPKPRTMTGASKNHKSHAIGDWLIFADKGGVGHALAQLLQERDQTCYLVYAGDAYNMIDGNNNTWYLNPTNPIDFENMFQEMYDTNTSPFEGIVHLWSLDAPLPDELTIPTLEEAQSLGCGSVLHLVQILLKKHYNSTLLWLVTQHAVPVKSGHMSALAQSPLWGLGKVVALEHPEIWGGMIDLAPVGNDAETIMREILEPDTEDLIAYRDGQRYVERLVSNRLTDLAGVSLVTDASYLITGGLGVLGLRVAQWMAVQGARHLILMSRREPSKQVKETLNQLQQSGVEILVAKADVADETAISTVFETIANTMPPLRGIIHAAGVLGSETITDITLNTLKSVLRSKVQGAWILHQLTQKMSLDIFVCFSSITSVWGSKGQAHYAAANNFLDALAHYRHGLGLPALSINWGPWADGGMASSEQTQTWLNRQGIETLPPSSAIDALSYLLGTDMCQSTVAHVNWPLLKELYTLRVQRPIFDQIKVHQPLTVSETLPKQESNILQRLKSVPESDGYKFFTTYLQEEVTNILGLEFSEWPTLQQGFFEMGMDSLMAVELKNRLVAILEVSLPVTLAFDYPNIQVLAQYLGNKIFGWEEEVALLREDKQGLSLTEIDKPLSDDEVEASIEQRLAKLESLGNTSQKNVN